MKIRTLDIPGLSESVLCDIKLDNKKGYLLLIYRSSNQSDEEFETFSFNFENTLSNLAIQNSHFNIVLGDFSARSSTWWSNDITNNEGTQIECLTSPYGFDQLTSLVARPICFNILRHTST